MPLDSITTAPALLHMMRATRRLNSGISGHVQRAGLPCIPHSKRYIFTVPDDVPHTFLCPRQIYHHTWQLGAGRIQLALQGSMGLPQTPQLGLEPCNKSKQFQLHQWLQMGKSCYLYQIIKMIKCKANLEPSCFCV